MNNTPVFNFIDFYKFDISLLYYKTSSVYDFAIVMDNVAGQTSKITCEFVDISTGDYGILKNNNNQVLIFKIVDIETDNSNQMVLTILSGLDLIDLYSFIPYTDTMITIDNLITTLNIDVDYMHLNGQVYVPYIYSGDPLPMTFQNTSEYFIKHATLIRKVIRSSNVRYNIRVHEGIFQEFELVFLDINLSISEKDVVGLHIKDTNLIADFTIHRSPNDYNIIQMLILDKEGTDYYDWYYRIKEDGSIFALIDSVVYTVDSNGELVVSTIPWDEDAILPEKISSEFMDEEFESEEVTVEQAAALTKKNASSTAYSLLRDQYYNHEIELTCYFENDKLDFTNLSDLFNTTIYLNIDGKIVTTNITRYEYNGDNLVYLKLGNARGNLTDKLRMKGVL